jgi:hypothetical protein
MARDVEIVRTVLEAWNESRPDSVSHLVSDDIAWLEVGGRLESAGFRAQRPGKRPFYVVTVGDGKIERIEAYRNPHEAFKAVDVSEREIAEAAS